MLISAGMYNAGQGMLLEAEDDFASAFEMFAPVKKNTNVMVSLPVSALLASLKSGMSRTCHTYPESRERREVDLLQLSRNFRIGFGGLSINKCHH